MVKNCVPVLLLTGYLGSGKTTLLNRILRNEQGIRFAVIVNDIGEVNIDAAMIEKSGMVTTKDDNLIPLQNGCICCTLKMDLLQQLHELCSSVDANNRCKFDYIVIEASGICEPVPIAQTICSYQKLLPPDNLPMPRLDSVVTVVDALRLFDEFDKGKRLIEFRQLGDKAPEDDLASLVIQQIEFCNLIILNKISELPPKKADNLKAIIRSLQPNVPIYPTDYCEIPLDYLVYTDKFSLEKAACSPAWMELLDKDATDDFQNEESGEQLEYGIGTFVYYNRKPFNIDLFDDFVARQWPKEVIRCKGLCYFQHEYDMCYVFEQSGHQVSLKPCGAFYATLPPEDLQDMLESDPALLKEWDDEYGDRMQKLVFIGQDMDSQAIKRQLDACLAE